MIKRLRKKFILIAIATVTSVMIILCAGVNIANYIYVTSGLDRTTGTIIQNRGKLPEPGRDAPHIPGEMRQFPKGGTERAEIEAPFQTRFFVLKTDADGEILEFNLDKIAAVDTDEIEVFAEIAAEHGEGTGYSDGYRYRVNKQDDGSYLAVFLDCNREMGSINTLLIISLLVTILCIALICAIIILLSGKAMKPVIESDIKQKQFITDASHELKTPITVINTCLSVLEMEVGKQKWIDKASAQTEKLKNLVNSLVALAKSDEETRMNITSFNISDAVKETVGSFDEVAQQNGHKLITDIEDGIDFSGDEYAVRQLVSILADNAVKYSSDDSDIEFRLCRHKKGVIIKSANKCDNIADDELPKLFDRFYRADKSRGGEKQGFGIGLSSARGICEKHKGYIKDANTGDGKIEFTAYLSNM